MEDTGRVRLFASLPADLVEKLRSLSLAGGVLEAVLPEMILREFFEQLAPEERLEFIKRRT